MKEYFTLEECMDQLGLKRSAILKRLKEGELKPVYENIPKKGGRRRYISVSSVAKYIKNHDNGGKRR
jgi:predicted DNA-binding transcriptional regulator AlpA